MNWAVIAPILIGVVFGIVAGLILFFANRYKYLAEPTGQSSFGRLGMLLVVLAICFVVIFYAFRQALTKDLLEGLAWFMVSAGTVLYAANKTAFAWGSNKLDIGPPGGGGAAG